MSHVLRSWLVLAVLMTATGCSSGDADADHGTSMRADSKYDFLLADESTADLHKHHQHDDDKTVAVIRSALRHDARPKVRVNAIVALAASKKDGAMQDFVFALDDADPVVVSEAAFSISNWAPESMSKSVDLGAMSALKDHVPRLVEALKNSDVRVRFNAASALVVLADTTVDLAPLLADPSSLVRGEAFKLAMARARTQHYLAQADVKALVQFSKTDSDSVARTQAVNMLVDVAPGAAASVISEALQRGDVDRSTAEAVEQKNLVTTIPAILAYLAKNPKQTYWLATLATLKATCAAGMIASLLDDSVTNYDALQALRKLAAKADADEQTLRRWAKEQRGDVAPCK